MKIIFALIILLFCHEAHALGEINYKADGPNLLSFDGFENGRENSSATLDGGTYSYDGSTVRTGDYALRTNPTTTGTGYTRLGSLATSGSRSQIMSQSEIYTVFYFRAETLPSTNDEQILYADDTAAAMKYELRINSSGNLVFYDSTNTLVATGSTALSTGKWYGIEVQADSAASAGYEIRINGTTELSGTASTGTTAHGHLYLGKYLDRNGESVDFYLDDIGIATDQWIGDLKVKALRPIGDGHLVDEAGGWAKIDENPPSNSTAAASIILLNATSHYSTLENTSTIGVGHGTIYGLMAVNHYRKSGGGGASWARTRIYSNGTIVGTTGQNVSNATAPYPHHCYLALTDPDTGSTWTRSGVDNAELGAIEVNARNNYYGTGSMHVAYSTIADFVPQTIILE